MAILWAFRFVTFPFATWAVGRWAVWGIGRGWGPERFGGRWGRCKHVQVGTREEGDEHKEEKDEGDEGRCGEHIGQQTTEIKSIRTLI